MIHVRRFLFIAIIICFSLTTVRSEDGCPKGLFPSDISHRCVPVSKYDRVVGSDEPMIFHARQISMHILWIGAEGIITKDTPTKFAKFLESYDAKITNVIEFHSPGGNLAAGLALGRMIRAAGYKTRIGRTISLSGNLMDVYRYKQALCMSACAYAFLGGVDRSFDKSDLYGLHRFSGDRVDGDAAQMVTSEIARYLEEMGVDQRVLRLASSADNKNMLPIPVSVAEELRIIFDPDKAYPFVVEDFKGSVVATTHFFFKDKFYNARLHCKSSRGPELVVWANTSAFPSAMIGLKERKALFRSNGENLSAVLNSGSFKNGISYMAFAIPNLKLRHFLGDGLSLAEIDNPLLSPLVEKVDPSDKSQGDTFYKRILWADSVVAVSFRIRAENADKTVPIVLRECQR